MDPYLNETAASLPSSTTFKAPGNVVTVNVLWFTSLVLSLAAALFGILAKQWCREYLKWHSVIASSRENVLIRQVRFDAWERWQVTSFIASIPAFLEIALVFFLVGLLIFVPTFSEHSLTIVVSVVIASILLGVVVLTILPVFYRLCPFQTPTGWAFVRLVDILHRFFWSIAKSVFDILTTLFRLTNSARPLRLFTLWYHSTNRLSRWEKLDDWRRRGLYAVQDTRFCCAAVPGVWDACAAMNLADVSGTSVDIVQTQILARALSWVRRGSSSEAVITAILDAVSTIHATSSTSEAGRSSRVMSSMYALCPVNLDAVRMVMQAFMRSSTPQPPLRLGNIHGPFISSFTRASEPQQNSLLVTQAWRQSGPTALSVCHALLQFDLLSHAKEWSASTASDAQITVAQQIELLFVLLRFVPDGDSVSYYDTDLTRRWADTMEEVFRILASHRDAYVTGIVPLCVELCRMLGPVRFEGEHGDERIVGEP